MPCPLQPDGPATTRRVLALVSLAPFMVVLDSNIVTVALPAIRHEFALSDTALQWVITATVLPFGGFLLIGGRAADLHGARRVLILGLTLFSVGSLAAGLAPSYGVLLTARAVLGLGAAMGFPAALALLASTFDEGPARNRALASYGIALSTGFVLAVALGGVLTQVLGWRAVLFVNVPLGALGVVLGPRVLPASARSAGHLGTDLTRATVATVGLVALLYGLTGLTRAGSRPLEIAGPLLLGLACSVLAVIADRRSQRPLLTPELLARKTVASAALASLVTVAAGVSVMVLISLYLQDVRGYTPPQAGLLLLPVGIAGALAAKAGPPLVRRFGVPFPLAGALLVQALGILLMTSIRSDGELTFLLAGLALMGAGHFTANVLSTTLATTGTAPTHQGVTVGLLGSAQQIGAGLGLALLLTVASTNSATLAGFRWALATGAALPVLAAACLLLVMRRTRP